MTDEELEGSRASMLATSVAPPRDMLRGAIRSRIELNEAERNARPAPEAAAVALSAIHVEAAA